MTVAHNEVLGTEKVIALDSSKIQEMMNGTFSNNGFFLKTDAELNDHFYYKTSDSAQTTQRPKLVIQYTLSPYTATPSLTPTPSSTPTPTFTNIASPSGTPSPTPTGPTSTPTNTSTPTITLTPSNTPSPTVTNTPTSTPTFTPSNTPTITLTPTFTLTPTITPTPSTPIFSNATFTYDADGRRVKSVLTTNVGSTTTYFVGNHYEITGSSITKYYYAGSQRIAMRENGTLSYVFGDHLGSTSIVTDSSGNLISQQKYKAWGETRYSSGGEVTEYQYTGQYSYESDFGLYFYNARFYDPSLGRFSSPDSLIPSLQEFDRYSYVGNNPINYKDPSGHCATGVVIDTVVCLGGIFAIAAIIGGGVNAGIQYLEDKTVDMNEVYGAGMATGTAAVVLTVTAPVSIPAVIFYGGVANVAGGQTGAVLEGALNTDENESFLENYAESGGVYNGEQIVNMDKVGIDFAAGAVVNTGSTLLKSYVSKFVYIDDPLATLKNYNPIQFKYVGAGQYTSYQQPLVSSAINTSTNVTISKFIADQFFNVIGEYFEQNLEIDFEELGGYFPQ